jgi:hypothetical protein
VRSRITRYLLYALGEIALVVIGILIALYVNDRRDYREDRRQELAYLREFHQDIRRNLEELDRVIEKSGRTTRACDSVIAYSKKDLGDVSDGRLLNFSDALLGYTKHMTQEGTIEDLMGSGNLGVIKNDTIRRAMATWHADLSLMRELEEDSKGSFKNYVEYLHHHFPSYELQPDMAYFKGTLLRQMVYLNRVVDRAVTTDYLHETYLGVRPRWEALLVTVGREVSRLERAGF